MGSQAEIFISYAHEDNLSPFLEEEGWVTAFHRALEVNLGQLVGRQLRPSIWRDSKLKGNDEFDGELVARLAKAAVLVCVVSPSYLGSDWCRRELQLFLQAGATGGLRGGKARLFKVVKTPVKLEILPVEMQKVIGYNFFKVDPERDTFMPLDPAIDRALRRDYWLKLNDLAQDMSQLLRSLPEPPKPGNGDGPKSDGGKPTVYLADTTFDLQREHDEIKRDVLRHGYRVVPSERLPLVASQLETFVREQLADCRLSIHLVGRKYGIVPEETEESVVALQNAVAAQRSGPGQLTRLIWLPPGLEAEDERQSKLVDALRRDNLNHLCADLLETSLEDLKTVIHQRLEAAKRAPRMDPPGDLVRVYLVCDQRDVEQSAALQRRLLEDLGLEVISPVFEGTEEELRQDHEENLATCDVVVIYYGEGNELWRRRKQRELLRSAGYGRQRKLLASAIYVAPPATPQKAGLRTNEAVVLRPDADPAALDAFLRDIRDARARHGI
jgi:hypothetical protein